MNNENELNMHSQESSIKQFTDMYDTVYKNLLKSESREDFIRFVKGDFINFSQLILVLGDREMSSETQREELYWFNYVIPESFKDIFSFVNELYFQVHKAKVYKKEGLKSKEEVRQIVDSSHQLLSANFEELKVLLNPQAYLISKDIDVDYNLKHHENPWLIYKDQLEKLQKQIALISECFIAINDQISVFSTLKAIITKHGDSVTKSCESLKEITNSIADALDRKDNPKNIINQISKIIDVDKEIDKTHQSFTEDLEFEINKLKQIEIPMYVIDGHLELEVCNLESSVRKWLDYEVLSNFIDLWALKDNLKNYFRISLTHIKNNLKVKLDTNEEVNYTTLYDSLNKLFDEIRRHQLKEEHIVETINIEVEENLKIAHYFGNVNPLEVPLKNTINFKGGDVFKKVRLWLGKITGPLFSSEQVHHDSDIETATRCISHRLMKVENEQYDSLFLNKNFIGDLFLIRRPVLERKIQHTIDLWRNGFNQSALITGTRLSGKTTFINYTSKLHFSKEILSLQPETEIVISGRKFKVDYDLGKVLREIKKYEHQNSETLVLIDDLELWKSEDITLLDNVRNLIRFLESETDHTFVMVSCSIFVKEILDNRLGFSQVFSTVVNVSQSSELEISQAIQLRHGASHKTLYNTKMEPISNQQMKKLIKKQAQKNKYNLGEVLQAWTYTSVVKDYNKVMITDKFLDFPNFFTPSELLVLKHIFMYRSSNEYTLKIEMGYRVDSDLRSTIKRLLNTKVLERDISGNLKINSIILQDVQIILQDVSILNKA